MKLLQVFRNEDGYTLLESVVAMALFVSVLIPVGVMIGNFILDDSSTMTTKALHAAESAMSRITVSKDFTNGIERTDDGMTIDRKVEGTGNVREAHITVFSQKSPKKKLLTLNKTFLVYR